MPYKLQTTLVSALAATITTIAFVVYMLERAAQESVSIENELSFWASGLLVFIVVRIIVQILASIVNGIVNGILNKGEISDITDERDNLIELHSSQVRDSIFSLGLVLATVLAASGQGAAIFFITLMVIGALSEVIEYIAKLIMYKKGV